VLSLGTLEYRAPDAGVRKIILKAREGQIIESGFNFHECPVLEFEASTGDTSEDQATNQEAIGKA